MTEPFFGPEGRALCALIAFALSVIAFYPYLRDTIAWKTRPQRASWLIWSVLSSISFVSQVAEGASTSLVYAGVQCAGTLTILALAWSRGLGGFLHPRDLLVISAAGAGLAIWYVTEDAAWALAISCSISLVGGTVTVAKAYWNPQTETMSFWMISFLAACFGAGSVGMWDPILLMYPVYLMVLKTAIITAMVLGRERLEREGHQRPHGAYPTIPAVPMAASAALVARRGLVS
ncbi:MAG: hypothetical protein AAF565_13040 [Pseudomonadota bacterium]